MMTGALVRRLVLQLLSALISQMAPFVVRLMRYARVVYVLEANVRALNSAPTNIVRQVMIVQKVFADMQA